MACINDSGVPVVELRELYTVETSSLTVAIVSPSKVSRPVEVPVGGGFTRIFIRKLLRGLVVKRNSYNEFVRWLQRNQSKEER